MKKIKIRDVEIEIDLSENFRQAIIADPRCSKKYLLVKTIRINRQTGEKIRGLTLKKYSS